MRQVSMGSMIYMADYDDRYMIARYAPDDASSAEHDRTWVQSVLPYTREFSTFLCPVDDTRDPSFGIFDADLVPGDTYARYYEASKRSNIGYNYLYLSPLVRDGEWQSRPRLSTEISDPGKTLVFGESAWEIEGGKPTGGGHYLIVPPCRYTVDGQVRDSFGLGDIDNGEVYVPHLRWLSQAGVEQEFQAGGLYPWFGEKVNVIMAAGQIRQVPMEQVTTGCDVKPDWTGLITNSSDYLWDIH